MRIVSWRQAFMRARDVSRSSVMSWTVENADRTSSLTFCIQSGCVRSMCKVPDSHVLVCERRGGGEVSAMNKIPLLY